MTRLLMFYVVLAGLCVAPRAMPVAARANETCPQHLGPPCPIYYNNTMPDYFEGDNTKTLLQSLHSKMAIKFDQYINQILTNMPPSAKDDSTFYYGSTGRAVLFLKLWANSNNSTAKKNYLNLAKGYIDNAIKSTEINYKGSLGYFLSFTGTYAVGAVIYDVIGDKQTSARYIQQVQAAMPHGLTNTDFTFDSGVPGLVQAGLYLNWFFKDNNTVTTASINNLADYMMERGTYWGKIHGNGTYLLWEYPMGLGWVSYGQGHGMFGTLQRLMDIQSVLNNKTSNKLVKNTIDFLVNMQLPDGQFPDPFALTKPNGDHHFGLEGAVDGDEFPLVQWCHGAPGSIPLFIKAWQIWGDAKYLTAAEKAADYTWKRGLLAKGLINCHGITGNAYMFIILYRATRNETYLWRALKFQEFVLDTPIVSEIGKMRVPTPAPYSVWQGSWVGASLLWADMLNIDATEWCISGFENQCL